jgi:hypothetical protein
VRGRAGSRLRGSSKRGAHLAQRSAAAAKEIKDLINDSAGKVKTGSQLVNESGERLSGIMESIKRLSDVIAEIAAASNEQARGIEQVNNAVTQMDQSTQQNAALVEEAAAASTLTQDQAQKLVWRIEFFRTEGSVGSRPERLGVAPARAGTKHRSLPSAGITSSARKSPNNRLARGLVDEREHIGTRGRAAG